MKGEEETQIKQAGERVIRKKIEKHSFRQTSGVTWSVDRNTKQFGQTSG
jgi:hypothetical protein